MAQLAGAGASEHDAQIPALLHQPMHHIEKLGCFLNPIDYHRGQLRRCRGDALRQAFWPGLQAAQHVRRQQIQPQRLRENLAQPGGFAGAPGAEQEEAPRRRLQQSPDHRHFCCGNGVLNSILRDWPVLRCLGLWPGWSA
jgi:hypothetical protein